MYINKLVLKLFKIILIIAFVVIISLLILAIVKRPEISYHEFPFKLTYELNGTIKEVEDAVICEYQGIKIHNEIGVYRQWTSRLKSGQDKITLLKVGETLEFYFDYGSAENYMGDPQSGQYRLDLFYNLTLIPYIKYENNLQIANSAMTANEVWNKYKLRIIKWEYTPPIKNNFLK